MIVSVTLPVAGGASGCLGVLSDEHPSSARAKARDFIVRVWNGTAVASRQERRIAEQWTLASSTAQMIAAITVATTSCSPGVDEGELLDLVANRADHRAIALARCAPPPSR